MLLFFFKQKTAYEIGSGLVGSEMCIRDRMCSVCGCDLPMEKNGTILRATRAAHNRGAKHNANLSRQREERKGMRRRILQQMRLDELQLKKDKSNALLLGIVATRLRSEHESVEDVRLAWLLESETLLLRLDNPGVEAALLEATTKAIAAAHLRSVAREGHLLMELLSEHL